MTAPDLSVVVPVYGCRECLHELHLRLTSSLAWLEGRYELVFVEDCGRDGSWETLEELALVDDRVRAFQLSRNFGQHAAITAGLAKATGRRVVVLDCDLQDPPEEIRRLYAKADEGYDVVFARRRRKGVVWHRRAASRLYFAFLRLFTGARLDGEYGSFSLISRKVVDAYLRLGDRDRHYLFILLWLGFRQSSIEYEQEERFAGRSAYGLRTLLRHALGGIFFQTTVLLRWVVYFGFALSLAGAVAAAYFTYYRLTGNAYPGWTSVIVALLVIGGFVIISTGVTGLYIGRIFEAVRRRPLYIIDRAAGREPADSEAPPTDELRGN